MLQNFSFKVRDSLTPRCDTSHPYCGARLEQPRIPSALIPQEKFSCAVAFQSKTKSYDGGGAYAMGKIGPGNGKLSSETKSGNVKVLQRQEIRLPTIEVRGTSSLWCEAVKIQGVK